MKERWRDQVEGEEMEEQKDEGACVEEMRNEVKSLKKGGEL